MGIERKYSPTYFGDRAAEFRAKADNCEHEQTRQTLSKVAEAYDELARRAELIRTVQDAAE
ncbi:hypothetical protein ACRQ5Q_18495 [Bradyrhizobium sp. PMVTL-01]|uniref:hypothetical protein n=1 Tax=Bradyrhizobium sp. PMVTL-01 TaxID=3434999 RepID=UPI003F6FBF36